MTSNLESTDLDTERREQARWRPRAKWRKARIFDQLLVNEFANPKDIETYLARQLARLVGFAARHVPYYRERWGELGITPGDVRGLGDLAKLPVLTRTDVQENGADLIAEGGLRPIDRGAYDTKSSGSTGQSVTVRHSHIAGNMWGFIKQREYRWFRTDPGKPMATLSSTGNLPRNPDGSPVAIGQTISLKSWRYVGSMFRTGPWFGYLNVSPIEQQIDWIRNVRPDYLVAHSTDIEHLSMAWGKGDVPGNLGWLLANSMELTDGMRRMIAKTFPLPLHHNYGLNEIGLVASVCPEGGRFHIHCENSLVEILDDAGDVCAPGTVGHLIVTSLNNRVMPLIRYDSDDLAEAAEGPCPCGRTLPSFARIHGRYRRTAFLPPGTYQLWRTFREIVPEMPPQLLENVRRYQLHHFLDRSFELRLELADRGSADRVTTWFDERWRTLIEEFGVDHPLTVTIVDRIGRPRGGKFQDFVSDFTPGPDDDGPAPVQEAGAWSDSQ